MKELQKLRNEVLSLRNIGELTKQTESILLHKINALEEAINYTRCCCKENYIFKKGDKVVYNGKFEAKVLVNEKNKLVQIQTATSLPTTVNKRTLKLK